MRLVLILIYLIFTAQLVFSQERVKQDTMIMLNVRAFDARFGELQAELKKQTETRDQTKILLQQCEDNIKSLQAALQTMMMVKQDSTLRVPQKLK